MKFDASEKAFKCNSNDDCSAGYKCSAPIPGDGTRVCVDEKLSGTQDTTNTVDTVGTEDGVSPPDTATEDQQLDVAPADTSGEDQLAADTRDASGEDTTIVLDGGVSDGVEPVDAIVTVDAIDPVDAGMPDSGGPDSGGGSDAVVSVDAVTSDVIITPVCGDPKSCGIINNCAALTPKTFAGTWTLRKDGATTSLFRTGFGDVCQSTALTTSLTIEKGALVIESHDLDSLPYAATIVGSVCVTMGTSAYNVPINVNVSGLLQVQSENQMRFTIETGGNIDPLCVAKDPAGKPLIIHVPLSQVSPNNVGMPNDLYQSVVLKLVFDTN